MRFHSKIFLILLTQRRYQAFIPKTMKEHKNENQSASYFPFFTSTVSFYSSWLTDRLEGKGTDAQKCVKKTVSIIQISLTPNWFLCLAGNYLITNPLLLRTLTCPDGSIFLLILESWSYVTFYFYPVSWLHFTTYLEGSGYKDSVSHFTPLSRSVSRAQPKALWWCKRKSGLPSPPTIL